MRAFLRRHSEKLLVIEDTPRSVAAGTAVGIFLGFTPLLGVKTLLALGIAALLRVSKVAAVLAVSLFDIVFPLWPVIYRVDLNANPNQQEGRSRHR